MPQVDDDDAAKDARKQRVSRSFRRLPAREGPAAAAPYVTAHTGWDRGRLW